MLKSYVDEMYRIEINWVFTDPACLAIHASISAWTVVSLALKAK